MDSVTKDISVNTIALASTAISGGTNTIGCLRSAANPLRVVVRARSAATASAMDKVGIGGP